MNHKTKSFIAVLLALCLMLSLGVGALADLNVVDPTPENIPSVTFGDPNTLTNTDPSTDPGADGTKYKVELSWDPDMGNAGAYLEDRSTPVPSEGVTAGTTIYIITRPHAGNETKSVQYIAQSGGSSYDDASKTQNLNEYTITMPEYDIRVAVEYGVPDPGPSTTAFDITISNTITNGNVTTDALMNKAVPKSTVILTAVPNNGFKLDYFLVHRSDGSSVAVNMTSETTGTFTMPNSDVTVYAVFTPVQTYNVNINGTFEGGSVTASPSSAAAGETVTLTASPDERYRLESFSVTYDDGIATLATTRATQTVSVTKTGENTGTFTMPAANVTVSATFSEIQSEPETHKILTSAPHADLYIQGGADREAGDTINFTVTPHRGYYVTRVWAGTTLLTPSSGWYSFQMPDIDITITVECELVWWPGYDHWHSIDASYDGDYGYVTVDSWAYVGDTVYFTVHPYYDSWYYWDYSVGVYTDGGEKLDVGHYAGDTWYFTMPNDDVTVYAWFDWYYGDYSVSKSVEGDGSIYVRSWADHGDKVWIDAVPQSGASLTSLNVYYNGGSWWYESLHGYYGRWYEVDVHYDSARGEYYFYMPAHDVVVEAVFTTVGETITVVKPDNGSLKLSTLRAEKGDLVYITVDPDKGYELSELEVLSSLGKNVEVTELSENYYVFRMPGLNVKVKAEFRLSAYTPFADVSPNAWYFEAVSFVYDKGLMEGTSNYAFSPDADLSRGMLAAILYRMAGSPEVSGYSTFGDVPTTAYYAKAIAWAQDHGIVTGVSAESYKPDSPVTREQLVAILSRYAQYKGYETSVSYDYLSTYGDASSASAYAREALNWAVARGVIDGQSGGVLAPTATASRAEVAQVLMNYLAVYA